jgi:predicted outer membrane repeat protein
MQGFGDKPGIKAFQLSCTGGTVTAKAHKVLKQFLGSNLPKQGVTWTEDTDCRPVETGCLLTICGQSDVVFANAKITGVKKAPGSSAYAQGDKALCVSQSSRVTLRNCIFSSSTITPLSTYNSTSVLLDRCNYTNNNMTEAAVSSGVWLRNGTVVVRSSTFMRNMGRGMETWGTGSTIAVSGDGRVAIVDSTFTGNTAERGGAMYVSDRAHATIYSSRFEANNASTWGGAIYARGQAKIDILPGEQYMMPFCPFLTSDAAVSRTRKYQ